MLNLSLTRAAAAIVAVTALALPATGCSSTRDQAAVTSLRGFTLSAHSVALATAGARRTVEVQRHAREHALAGVRTIQTLHHQAARNL